MSQLPSDCLNEIFEYLEDDKVTSYGKQLLNKQYISPQNLNNNLSKVTREIFKFLIAQTSLRELNLFEGSQEFISIPGVMGCLGNLSELSCSSNLNPEFFYCL